MQKWRTNFVSRSLEKLGKIKPNRIKEFPEEFSLSLVKLQFVLNADIF